MIEPNVLEKEKGYYDINGLFIKENLDHQTAYNIKCSLGGRDENEEKEIISNDDFKWTKRRYHLTFKGWIPLQELHDFIVEQIKPNSLKDYSYANENSDITHPYKHTHAEIWVKNQLRWKGSKRLLHPKCEAPHYHIQPIDDDEHWDRIFFKYHRGFKVKNKQEVLIPPIDLMQSDYQGKIKNFAKSHDDSVDYIKSCKDLKDLFDIKGNIGKYIAGHLQWAERLYSLTHINVETIIKQDGTNFLPWQEEMFHILQEKPHPRSIYWLCDQNGGTGKSEFMKYLIKYHNAFLAQGSAKDILYAYQGEPIVIFYCCKSMEDHLSFQAMECLKDGTFFVQKYISIMKGFPIPHVVVLTNSYPDTKKCSEDRWNIWELTKEGHTDMDPTIAQSFYERKIHRIELQKEEKRKRIRDEVYNNTNSNISTSSSSPFHKDDHRLLLSMNTAMQSLNNHITKKQKTITDLL